MSRKKIRHYPGHVGQNGNNQFRLIHDQGRVITEYRNQWRKLGVKEQEAPKDCRELIKRRQDGS